MCVVCQERDGFRSAAQEECLLLGRNYNDHAVTKRLGLEGSGGMVRVDLVHYNTLDEIHRFAEVLGRLVAK